MLFRLFFKDILGRYVLTLVGLVLLTFTICRLIPIDPAVAVAGEHASTATYEQVRAKLGLNKPVIDQLWIYGKQILRGDLGKSFITDQPIRNDLMRVFPATLELATYAMIIAILTGIPLGFLAAMYHHKKLDGFLRILSLSGYSTPMFLSGPIMLLIFYHWLNLTAGPGQLSPIFDGAIPDVTGFITIDTLLARNYEAFWDSVRHIILPVLVLSYYAMTFLMRMTRSFVLRELQQNYVTVARMKGLPRRLIMQRHVLPNVIVPLSAFIILTYGGLLEGAILTEAVFAWPGLGSYMTQSLLSNDMNAIMGATLLIGFIYATLNFLADCWYRWLDPRRYQA